MRGCEEEGSELHVAIVAVQVKRMSCDRETARAITTLPYYVAYGTEEIAQAQEEPGLRSWVSHLSPWA